MSRHHHHAPRAQAARPTASLLRFSAGERLGLAGLMLAGLWLAVFSVVG